MAIIDSRLMFGENVDVSSGPNILGDFIDFGAYEASGARDAIARGEPVWWVCLVGDRGTGGTSLRFRLQTRPSLNGNDETLVIGRKFAASELFSGLHFVSSLPVTSISPPRFLKCRTNQEGTFTGLRVTSYLTATPPIFSNDNFIDWR